MQRRSSRHRRRGAWEWLYTLPPTAQAPKDRCEPSSSTGSVLRPSSRSARSCRFGKATSSRKTTGTKVQTALAGFRHPPERELHVRFVVERADDS